MLILRPTLADFRPKRGDVSVGRVDRSVLDLDNVLNDLALRHYIGMRWSTPLYSRLRRYQGGALWY
jgi:hypothetical protein